MEQLNLNPQQNEFLDDVIHGLQQSQKTLPCKYFYDKKGSDLFEQICHLDEYYLTRSELEIIKKHGKEIAYFLGANATMIEPGSGAGIKIQRLMAKMDIPQHYIGLDISPSILDYSVKTISKRFPFVKVHSACGDFFDQNFIEHALDDFNSRSSQKSKNKVVFFPGSTIGNFEHQAAKQLLKNFAKIAGKSGKLLIGIDLIKDLDKLIAAYNDKKGITAEFNKNILHRINKELGAELEGGIAVDECFRHAAVFNSHRSRMEMHLQAIKPLKIKLAGLEFEFKQGETIHTENSHKYSLKSFKQLSADVGLNIEKVWQDESENFALILLSV